MKRKCKGKNDNEKYLIRHGDLAVWVRLHANNQLYASTYVWMYTHKYFYIKIAVYTYMSVCCGVRLQGETLSFRLHSKRPSTARRG